MVGQRGLSGGVLFLLACLTIWCHDDADKTYTAIRTVLRNDGRCHKSLLMTKHTCPLRLSAAANSEWYLLNSTQHSCP